MYQPQDPRSGQLPPQQPPVYPEVKPLPKGWQTPIQPQQPQQFYQQPQPVYYQQPVAVKQWPGWATALLVIGAVTLIVIVGAVINSMKPSSTTTTANQQQVVATAAPTQRIVQAAPTTVVSVLKVGRVGDTVALNGYTITINKIEKSESFDGSDIFKAKEGNVYIAVDVTVGSNKAKGVSSNGLNSAVKDSQGFKYDVAILGSKTPLLPGESDLAPGDKARGWLTFEVPKTATGLVFEYSQLFESEKIRIALD